MKFTDKMIKNLPAKESRYDIREADGFAIRVSPSGRKTWVFIYDYCGKRRRMNLGVYGSEPPEVTLKEARKRHSKALALLRDGKDPAGMALSEKEENRRAPTVEDMVGEFLSRHVKEKASRSHDEYKRNLEKDVIPTWGKLKVKDITRRDVHNLLDSILDRGAPNQANQVFKIVRCMFGWASSRYELEYNPCSNIKLPSKENKKDRFFTEEEIRVFWNELNSAGMSDRIKSALRLILITGQRPGEIISLHRQEIEGEWWTIPAEKAKNKKEHRVYLSPLARKILAGLPEEGYLFPSPRGEKPIEVNALAHAIRRNSIWGRKEGINKEDGKEPFSFSINEPWTPHDLRRTCATHLGEAGYPEEVIGRVLNHTRQGITARYNRHAYDKEIQTALESWGRKIEQIITNKRGTNVIPLKRVK